MEYGTAKSIRGRTLSSLVTQKIRAGGGVTSAIRSSVSEKMRAKGLGIKEKFDPLNIAKFLTGGSNLAPAILGRLTGRKQSDINYFSGGRKTATELKKTKALGALPTESSDSIVSIFNLVKKNYERDLQLRETERSFQEEKANEEQRRHNEFLKVLKDYTSGGTAVAVETKKEGGGFLDLLSTVKTMIENSIKGTIETIQKMFEWVSELKILRSLISFVPKLVTFLGTPLAGVLLGLTGIAGLAGALYYLVRSDTPPGEETAATKGLTPSEAAIQTAGFVPSKRYTEEDVKTMADERKVINRMEDFKLRIRNMTFFGQSQDRVDKYLDEYAKSGDPVDSEAANRLIQQRSREKYGAKESFRKSEISDRNMLENADYGAKESFRAGEINTQNAEEKTTPMSPLPTVPSSSSVFDTSDENMSLNMNSSMAPATTTAPIVSNTVNNTSTEESIPTTATVRDRVHILDRIFEQSNSYV